MSRKNNKNNQKLYTSNYSDSIKKSIKIFLKINSF